MFLEFCGKLLKMGKPKANKKMKFINFLEEIKKPHK